MAGLCRVGGGFVFLFLCVPRLRPVPFRVFLGVGLGLEFGNEIRLVFGDLLFLRDRLYIKESS